MSLPYRSGQSLGWLLPCGTPAAGNNTIAVNAAATWYGASFVAPPDVARTVSAVRLYVSAVAGTLGASDITCDLYDSAGASGVPGAAVETGKVPSATITAAGWYDLTGFASALTPGQVYWAVLKNVNGVPASNNCSFRAVSYPNAMALGSSPRQAWSTASSSNSGSTWSRNLDTVGIRLAYADGSYDGILTSLIAAGAIGDGVYATRESGQKFTSPLNSVLRIYGVGLVLSAPTGTPTNGFRFGLWTGSTPVNQGYTTTLPLTANSSQAFNYSYFSSPITLPPGTITRVTLATSGADASSKRYGINEFFWDTDANSVLLLPWNGTATKTYYDGSSWTDSPLGTSLFGHALLLDPAQEFGTPYRRSELIQSIGTY